MNRTIEKPIARDRVRFLKTAEETNGVRLLTDVALAAAGATPQRCHKPFNGALMAFDGLLGLLSA